MKNLIPCFLVAIIPLAGCKPSSSTTETSDGKTITKTTTVTVPADTVPVVPITSPTLSQANLDRVQKDMSKAEVETIFGQPTSSHDEPIPIVGGTQTTYTYQSGNSAVTILFKNDKVMEKSGTFNPSPGI